MVESSFFAVFFLNNNKKAGPARKMMWFLFFFKLLVPQVLLPTDAIPSSPLFIRHALFVHCRLLFIISNSHHRGFTLR